jgi:2-iminoacetate synthase ThiH
MSALVEQAIASSGLAPVLAARREGTLDEAAVGRVRGADLLALGALADRVRAEEVGDDVRIYTRDEGDGDDGVIVLPRSAGAGVGVGASAGAGAGELTGLELLREVALTRVTAARGARVRVDWSRCGLELAQVALGFGANELVGHIANKRGLPMAEDETLGVGKKSTREAAHAVKRKELAGFVRRAGRTPLFVGEEGS